MSIKWRIFACLVAFAAVILSFLWIFQVALLDTFYQNIKINDIKSAAQEIRNNIDNDDRKELLDELAQKKQISIVITTSMGMPIYRSGYIPNLVIDGLDLRGYQYIYTKTVNAGGSFLARSSIVGISSVTGEKEIELHAISDSKKDSPPKTGGLPETLLYANIFMGKDGREQVVLLNSELTPVQATVDTLRVQLAWVTFIMIVLALLIALFLSRWISLPMIKINHSAKQLATGDYNIHFDEVGYKEIVELAKTLNYAVQELSKVEGLQRELIANISHDLRTPLTMIAGYSEIMRDIPGENTPENVQVIIDEANRLTTLVNDVLDISKLQSGTLQMNMAEFDLTESVRKILLRYNKLVDYDIQFLSEGEAWVLGDELKISQVVYNLVNNAITYTGDDKRVTITQIFPQENRVRIEVTDTGEGLEANQLNDIWNRYYKVDKAHKRAQIGTGLGLSIVKTILDLHAGASYGVRSTLGKGSTFWFELTTKKIENRWLLEEKKDE